MRLNKCRTTLQIDIDALRNNLSLIKEKCKVPVMAVVKADAYGHGAIEVARCTEDLCEFFGVACIDEALELRMSGITKPILILGSTPISRFDDVVNYDIRISLFEYDCAVELSKIAVELGKKVPFHFALDTGMNRIGFKADESSIELCRRICSLPGIYPEGIFTHFTSADSNDLEFTHNQRRAFSDFVNELESIGIEIPIKHTDNSAGILDYDSHYNMVRSGIITYGFYPSDQVIKSISGLKPAMRWESYISYIKTVPAGQPISYGGTFITDKETVIATIPVGYADGYPRILSDSFYVLIEGKKAPILGRICMDQLMVDVTHIKNAVKGSKVTLLGIDGDLEISAELISQAANSFNYEFICGISRRVTRIYYKNAKAVKYVNYLLDNIEHLPS